MELPDREIVVYKPQCLIIKSPETETPYFIECMVDAITLTDLEKFAEKLEKENFGFDAVFIDRGHRDSKKIWKHVNSLPESKSIYLHLPGVEDATSINRSNTLKFLYKLLEKNENEKLGNVCLEIDNLLKSYSHEDNLHNALKPALIQIGRYCGAGRLSVQLIFGTGKEVASAVEKPAGEVRYKTIKEIIGFKSQLKEGVSGRVIESGEVVFCDSAKTNGGEKEEYRDSRFIAVPIVNRTVIIGVLNITSFTRDIVDIDLLKKQLLLMVSQFGPTIAMIQNDNKLLRLNDKLVEYQKTREFLLRTLKHDFINSMEGDVKFIANSVKDSLIKARLENEEEARRLKSPAMPLEEALASMLDGRPLSEEMLGQFKRNASDYLLSLEKTECLSDYYDGAIMLVERLIFLLDHLTALIRDIGSLSEPVVHEIDFYEFTDDYRKEYEPIYNSQIEQRNIQVEWILEGKGTIQFDRKHLARVCNNLISNAIKFSPDGGKVSVSTIAEPDFIKFKVSDEGIGIPEKNLEDIFKSGFRAENAREHGIPGTGTGLGYVRYILDRCGGEVSCQSPHHNGKGSAFEVVFPRVTEAAPKQLVRNKRILVICKGDIIDDLVEKLGGMSGKNVGEFEIVKQESEIADINGVMKDFGAVIYHGNNEDKEGAMLVAKKLDAVAVCMNRRNEGGAVIASKENTLSVEDDPFQMSMLPEMILSELGEL